MFSEICTFGHQFFHIRATTVRHDHMEKVVAGGTTKTLVVLHDQSIVAPLCAAVQPTYVSIINRTDRLDKTELCEREKTTTKMKTKTDFYPRRSKFDS